MKRNLGANTFIYPAPVLLVGSYDAAGRANLMAAAWAGVCCSKPPCVSIALRRATYTHGNIVSRRAFTVAVPSASQVEKADYLGIYSGRHEDKFAVLGLTARRAEQVEAPYAEEFPLVLECRLIHTLELGLHTMFVGEVLAARAEENVLGPDGKIDVSVLDPLVYAPVVREYFRLGERLGRAFHLGRKPESDGDSTP